jgi:hypothetical protein
MGARVPCVEPSELMNIRFQKKNTPSVFILMGARVLNNKLKMSCATENLHHNKKNFLVLR